MISFCLHIAGKLIVIISFLGKTLGFFRFLQSFAAITFGKNGFSYGFLGKILGNGLNKVE